MITLSDLKRSIDWLDHLAIKDPTGFGTAAAKGKELLVDFEAATTAGNAPQANAAAIDILWIVQSCSALLEQKRSGSWPKVGIAALAAVFISVTTFLAWYGYSVGASGLATIEGGRPLLVITAIISTIAFGGALLIGSMFSSEGSLEDRFRRAREVFLVFSGIFGTVVGFYFGAGDSPGGPLLVDAKQEGTVVIASVSGGSSPYRLTAIFGPNGESMTEETTTGLVRFEGTGDRVKQTTFFAIDGRGLQGTLVKEFNADESTKPTQDKATPDASKPAKSAAS